MTLATNILNFQILWNQVTTLKVKAITENWDTVTVEVTEAIDWIVE